MTSIVLNCCKIRTGGTSTRIKMVSLSFLFKIVVIFRNIDPVCVNCEDLNSGAGKELFHRLNITQKEPVYEQNMRTAK